LIFGQRLFGRHLAARHIFVQQAILGFSRFDRGATLSTSDGTLTGAKIETPFSGITVTFQAVTYQNGCDLLLKKFFRCLPIVSHDRPTDRDR